MFPYCDWSSQNSFDNVSKIFKGKVLLFVEDLAYGCYCQQHQVLNFTVLDGQNCYVPFLWLKVTNSFDNVPSRIHFTLTAYPASSISQFYGLKGTNLLCSLIATKGHKIVLLLFWKIFKRKILLLFGRISISTARGNTQAGFIFLCRIGLLLPATSISQLFCLKWSNMLCSL